MNAMDTVATSTPNRTPEFERVQASIKHQGMMQNLGVRLVRVAAGEVELALPYSDKVTQQQGGFHGGAMGALADIAGGYAGLTA
jgi:acyl-coenzyme A thioesterase PaaI-like protein